jgi:hypothetical protein
VTVTDDEVNPRPHDAYHKVITALSEPLGDAMYPVGATAGSADG